MERVAIYGKDGSGVLVPRARVRSQPPVSEPRGAPSPSHCSIGTARSGGMSQDHLVPIPVDRRGGPAREQHILQGRHQMVVGQRRVGRPSA